MTTTVICLIAAGLITAVNVVIMRANNKQAKAVQAWHEAHRLKEFEKRRMCSSYCKHRDTAKTQEDLDMQCEICTLNKL